MRTRARLVCLLLLAGCGPSKPYRTVLEDARYAEHGAATFDYHRPVDAGRRDVPALIVIHGGGWRSGDKGWGRRVAEEWCPRGYGVVSINYRLAPAHRWPAQLEDCRAALAHVRSRSRALRVDPGRIGALGHSAGGNLAALLALRGEERARCAVTVSGSSDLTVLGSAPVMDREQGLLQDVLGPGPWPPALLAELSPARHARRDAAVLVAHALGDTNVFFDQAARLHGALVAAGADTDLVVLADGSHERTWREPRVLRRSAAFLRAHLGGRVHRRAASLLQDLLQAGPDRERAIALEEALLR